MERGIYNLRNGSEEVQGLVKVTMLALNWLYNEQRMVFYDLVEKCKNKDYKWLGDNESQAMKSGLVDSNGNIHQSIRNIILSAVEGEGLDMHLVNPILEEVS